MVGHSTVTVSYCRWRSAAVRVGAARGAGGAGLIAPALWGRAALRCSVRVGRSSEGITGATTAAISTEWHAAAEEECCSRRANGCRRALRVRGEGCLLVCSR